MLNFVGKWQNEERNELYIRPFLKGRYLVKFVRKDGKLLLPNKIQLFLHMFPFGRLGKIIEDELVINLQGPMGPTLNLKFNSEGGEEIILPEIGPSLYDGYEHVIGIPWLMPLSPFRKC